jgi:rhamnose transport system permease protein
VPSIIVTLGTLALYRSFLVEWSDAKTITTASLPQWLVDLPPPTPSRWARWTSA